MCSNESKVKKRPRVLVRSRSLDRPTFGLETALHGVTRGYVVEVDTGPQLDGSSHRARVALIIAHRSSKM